ncbi:hypothetical protein F442_17612 [Phytophthora nicotianae P10297]|uniref:C2H2-type domain-containing protein n=2 Tax=Phytophthora nicotianae TaxID=4792 RepID=W2YH53_PHYNI|nr:hypothetical protein L914_17083 [Phytophthora nicotianae]ETP33973.1 hypothetical protein F442_17612 [Phytophthora nicotianae P10297]
MRRFCWRERSEKLNWRFLGALDVSNVVRRGDPAVLEPYALHITFARLPSTLKDSTTRDAWFLVRVLQLAMEYLLYMRARDGDVLESLSQELRQVEQERDELVVSTQKWKARARSGDKQVDKLHQVLQNIAKLLQIHGASPSAVATIETLLTELISERRAKQKSRALMEKNDEEIANVRPAVQEARVCGYCGKLFSSAEYLEKHLVRRHGGESVNVEIPVKHKMQQLYEEVRETKAKNEDSAASEAAMQKMVQQVEKALHDHEEKLRSLAEEETQKVKQMYERLQSETQRAEEMRISRLAAEQQQESLRQLEEINLQKQKAEDELADLKQQIHFLTSKKKMMRTPTKAVVPATLPANNNDALIAAEMEIRELQQTLDAVNAELALAREELTQVQALHLSALRKKKELADKLALSREPSPVVKQENSSQTEQHAMINETVQTDEQSSPLPVKNVKLTESSAPECADVGTDPLTLSYEDVGIQTLGISQESEPSVDAEARVSIIDDLVLEHEPASSPAATVQILDDSATVDVSVDEKVTSSELAKRDDEERLPDYIQRINSQDLLDTIDERADSAASKAALNPAPESRNYSSISRHKYVRSRFQHDESVVKERVSSCLAQLEQFSSRFGVPPKSVRLSEGNLQIVQQALHGHLEVLPTDVLSRMVECENAVNAIIEKEWIPMEKTRQQALERFKAETRVRSEISQGLVRQAMASFGALMNANQPRDIESSGQVATVDAANVEELPIERQEDEDSAHKAAADTQTDSGTAPVRRYSANNQLTVVVGGEPTTADTAHLAGSFEEAKMWSPSTKSAIDTTEVEEQAQPCEEQETINVEHLKCNDEASILAETAESEIESQVMVDNTSTGDLEFPEASDTGLDTLAHQITSIAVGAGTDDTRRSDEGVVDAPASLSLELQAVSPQENDENNRRVEWQHEEQEMQHEGSQWHLPRVGSSSELGKRPVRTDSLNLPRSTDSLQSDRLSDVQDMTIDPASRNDHVHSTAMSSNMSFGTSIVTLDESESVDSPTRIMELVDAVDDGDATITKEESASSISRESPPATTQDDQIDSVMSFDDSDIEEVVLT